jgi:hypothetical protein
MTYKRIYFFLRFGCLPTGLACLWIGWKLSLPLGWEAAPLTLLKLFSLVAGIMATLTGLLVIQNVYFSRNHSRVNPKLSLETWPVTHDRLHNSNVDLVWYQNAFYLAHAASPFHFGCEDCVLLVKRSLDGHNWEQVAVLGRGQDDIRDPKFAVIAGKLFLYVFLNRSTQPLPYTTRVSWTVDGENWSDLASVGHEGWLFWRPKTRDGRTWYVPAYWHRFHHNALFTTPDGLNFTQIATISTRRFINEPEIEFLSDGSLLATGRGDYLKESFRQIIGLPESSTLISVAQPPYLDWQETAESQLTRLDGPVMFSHNQQIYAVGRSHPYPGGIFPQRGAVISKKRTAVYAVSPQGLIHLTDLPSCGDTSYAGVVLKDGYAYIAYYTNDLRKDYIWLFGMLEPSEIRLAKISLSELEKILPDN